MEDVRKKALEADIRNYRRLKYEGLSALLDSGTHDEDLNSWIKGSRMHTEQALSNLIRKESDPVFTNRMNKFEAITRMFERLTPELKNIVSVYMWGEYDYLSWPEIAEHEYCSKKTVYRWRDKIILTYAEECGEIQKR